MEDRKASSEIGPLELSLVPLDFYPSARASIFRIYFIFNMCVRGKGEGEIERKRERCSHGSVVLVGFRGGGIRPLELELQAIVGHPVWVLATKPWSSTKAVHSLDC